MKKQSKTRAAKESLKQEAIHNKRPLWQQPKQTVSRDVRRMQDPNRLLGGKRTDTHGTKAVSSDIQVRNRLISPNQSIYRRERIREFMADKSDREYIPSFGAFTFYTSKS